jgi:hypothetical protein
VIVRRVYYMNSLNKLLIIIALVGFAAGCAEDVVLPPLPSLIGKYKGVYIVDETALEGGTKHSVNVEWIFTTQSYRMDVDTTVTNSGFCQPRGEYALGNGVELQEGANLNGCTGSIAKESWNPRGLFQLFQPPDSIIMKKTEADGVEKEIRLKRLE